MKALLGARGLSLHGMPLQGRPELGYRFVLDDLDN
jgi:hypothetical protein